jgi:hypothetical protein
MRVLFARHSKHAHAIVVDGRGRARLTGPGAGSLKTYGLAAACALIAIAPMTGPGEALVASGRAAAQNAADFIRSRSPGLRTRADLVKTKVRRAQRARPVAHAAPRRRAAARPTVAFLAPPPPAVPLAFASAPLVPPFQPVYAGPVPLFEEAGAVPCCFAGFNPPLAPIGGIIIGGGGGGPGPPPPPGVPEPSAWTMMILGFAFLGAVWRRRRLPLHLMRELRRLFHERMLLLAHARLD